MIPLEEAIRIMNDQRGDSLAVFSYTGGRLWRRISERPELDLPCGASMGKVADVALGIAIARPDRRVLAIDGDGALMMNLGGLITVAGMDPKNFCYVILQDNAYLTTGGQPVPGKGNVDFATIAKGSGFANCYNFEDLEEFSSLFQSLLEMPGPTFINLRVENPAQLPTAPRSRGFGEAARDMAEALRASDTAD